MPWNGYERRRNGGFSDGDIQAIADGVADLLEDRLPDRIGGKVWESCEREFTLAAGKWAIRVALSLVGAGLAACYLLVQFLQAKGVI